MQVEKSEPSYETLVNVLCTILDGLEWYDLMSYTGLSESYCKKVFEIRNSVQHLETLNVN